jgi:hypothetical protein
MLQIKNGSYLHNYSDPLLSTSLKHLWQQWQPRVLGVMLQTCHTFIWGVSLILLCRYSQALSGWIGSIATQLILGLSRDVRSGSSPGSGWAIRGHSETCAEATPELSWLCAYSRCPFGSWTFAPVLSAPEQVFIKDFNPVGASGRICTSLPRVV